jgi:diguanylate cyclase (GGDEF)-like protein
MLDIDHFKKINDEHGHAAGDAILRQLAEILRHASRAEDMVFRYGGEEFAAILTNAPLKIALQIAERIRTQVEASSFQWEGRKIPVTLSIGVAVAGGKDADGEALIRAADAALYQAKQSGRNRVAADAAQ